MKEFVEREKVIDLFYPVDPENDGSDGCTVVYKAGNYSSDEIEAMISDLPAADVAPIQRGGDMAEYEKLIERLRDAGWTNPGLTDKQSLEFDAADAISELLAENEKMRVELDMVKRCIEVVESQRDAAIKDLKIVAACDTCSHERSQACSGCDDAENWEWRGTMKDDTRKG